MVYGYARISTTKQNIDRQIRNILAANPNAKIIEERYTGTTTDRPEWNKLASRVKAGDTIIFDSVSRMSRNADEGYEIYQKLYKQEVSLIFLKEPHINTATYKAALEASKMQKTGSAVDLILDGVERYLMELAKEQIKLAFEQAQKEVDDLRQRTKEGIETARKAGKQIGMEAGRKLETKKGETVKQTILKHAKDFGGTLSDKECIKLAGCTPNTYYKYKQLLKEERHA